MGGKHVTNNALNNEDNFMDRSCAMTSGYIYCVKAVIKNGVNSRINDAVISNSFLHNAVHLLPRWTGYKFEVYTKLTIRNMVRFLRTEMAN